MCSNPQIGGVSAPRLKQKGGGNVPRNPERIPRFCWSKQKVYGLVVPCWVLISTLSVGIPIKKWPRFCLRSASCAWPQRGERTHRELFC